MGGNIGTGEMTVCPPPRKLGNGGGSTGVLLGPPDMDGAVRKKLGRIAIPSSPGGRFSRLPHIGGSKFEFAVCGV